MYKLVDDKVHERNKNVFKEAQNSESVKKFSHLIYVKIKLSIQVSKSFPISFINLFVSDAFRRKPQYSHTSNCANMT